MLMGQCKQGYEGALCSECAADWVASKSTCTKCEDSDIVVAWSIVAIVAVVLVIIGLRKRQKRLERRS
eukprot:COSAG05_NODE_23310_length_259_cov_0.543750_1_plen_67_part_01